jgi:hypothetical protein
MNEQQHWCSKTALERKHPSASLITTNPTWTGLRLNSNLCGEKLLIYLLFVYLFLLLVF